MHSIYSNAYITIAACSAANCNEGFLQARNPDIKPDETPSRVPFGSTGGHVTLQKYVHPVFDFLIGQGGLAPLRESINKRAWTFQEQYLSRRMLFFSKTLVFWLCCEFLGKEGPRVREHYLGTELSRRVLRQPTLADWTRVVKEYSVRSMSDPHDKLPALSSIITYFASRTHSRYVAGICVAELPYQLCWKLSTAGERPTVWRAPSWSWASVDVPVYFPPKNELNFHPACSSIKLGCSILDCQATPLSAAAPFGQVSSGFLQVRGRMLRCQPVYDSGENRTLMYRIQEFIPATGQTEGGELDFDALNKSFFDPGYPHGPHGVSTSQGDEPWEEPVYCLLLCTQQRTIRYSEVQQPRNEEVWWPFGLALRKTGNGDFHRVGLFHGNGSSLKAFSEVGPETIRII
jgi:hypothetical protein